MKTLLWKKMLKNCNWRLGKYFPKTFQNILNRIFKSIVEPTIDYGISIYGFTNRIQRLLNRAARVVSQSGDEYHYLFERLYWKTFLCRRKYFSSIVIYKCLNKLSPKLCEDLFVIKETIASKTRSATNEELSIPRKTSNQFGNSIFCTGAKLFNTLDINIRKQDFDSFVKSLRKLNFIYFIFLSFYSFFYIWI